MTDTTSNATSFVAPGVTAPAAGAADDTTVIYEHEGRKYTRSDLANKLTNADSHIKKLEGENAANVALLEKVNKTLETQVSMEQMLKAIKEGQTPAAAAAAAAASGTVPAALTVEQIQALASASAQTTIAESVAKAQSDTNWATVTTTLTKVYGDKTDAVVAKAAGENGLTIAAAEALARTNPKLFLKMFELTVAATPKPFGNGNVNPQEFYRNSAGQVKKEPGRYWKATNTREQTSAYLEALNAKAAG